MENENSGWDRIDEQNKENIKSNKRKENFDKGYNISMGLIGIIIIVGLAFMIAIAKMFGAF